MTLYQMTRQGRDWQVAEAGRFDTPFEAIEWATSRRLVGCYAIDTGTGEGYTFAVDAAGDYQMDPEELEELVSFAPGWGVCVV